MLIIGRKTQERKITDKIKKEKDIKEDEKSLKGQEKKENRKYLHFFFNPLQPSVSFLYPLKTSEKLKVF